MVLSDEIRSLRDRVIGDLNSSYDYYSDAKIAWRIVRKVVAAGTTFSIRNMTTGTTTSQDDLAAKARGYVSEQLAEATFQQFISIFEDFFVDRLRLWLMAYPQNLIGKKVDFKSVLDALDKEAIVLFVVNRELNEVLYERPSGWFAYLDGKAKLGCPSADEIERIAAAKASRDVFAHHRGIASKIY